ncbi:MAG: hypothetical protein FVQ84_08320 [Planctomycetes bacterium]|nr:hypothetical protein [Planctomycetota bacterium]
MSTIQKRYEIVQDICKKTGLRDRSNPRSDYLTTRELFCINSWISVALWRFEKSKVIDNPKKKEKS